MKTGKRLFAWHHWCGLIVGLFLLVMSLSGSLLVFAEEIESAEISSFNKTNNESGAFFIDSSLRQVQSKYPGWEIRLYDQPKKNETIIYELRRDTESKKIYVHPTNGTILHVNENAKNELQRWLLLLHYTLFAGTTGKVAVFIIGLMFLITLFTGLWVYRRSFVKVLSFKTRINKKSTRGTFSSLHRIIGVWSIIFNLLMVFTGLVLSYQVATNALKMVPAKKITTAAPEISVDQVRNKVQAQYEDFNIHLVRIRPHSSQVQVLGRFDNDPTWYGHYYSGFVFDGITQEQESKIFMKDLPFTSRLIKMCGPLHFGNYGGLILKIFYSFLGLTPAFLSISGFIIWIKKKKRKI